MILDAHGQTATKGQVGACPICGSELRPKCGRIRTHHWAHTEAECDPWSEPESEWHRRWKLHYAARGDAIEVRIGNHRADVVTSSGLVVELQTRPLSVDEIEVREQFYGNMIWIYRADRWAERIHRGSKGFWWKHGSRSMTHHRKPIWWHVDNEVWRVSLSAVDRYEWVYNTPFVVGKRVVGRILDVKPSPLKQE